MKRTRSESKIPDEGASASSNPSREDPTSLLKCALAMFEDDYQKRKQELEQRARDFHLLLQRVEEAHAKIGDRVRLNLRGTVFEVPKANLLRFPGSFFSGLLASGSANESANGTNIATYFIDRSPVAFDHVLDYLSSGEDLYLDGQPPATIRAVLEHLDFFHLPMPSRGVFSQWYPNNSVSSPYFRILGPLLSWRFPEAFANDSGHHFWIAFCSRELSPSVMRFMVLNVAECAAWIRLGLVKKRLCRPDKDLAVQLGTVGAAYTIQINNEGAFTDVSDDEKGSQDGPFADIKGGNVVVEYRLVCHNGVPFKVRFTIDDDPKKSAEFRIAKSSDSEFVFGLCTNAPTGALNLLDLSFQPLEEEYDEDDDADDEDNERGDLHDDDEVSDGEQQSSESQESSESD